MPEQNIDGSRWRSNLGPEYYSFVRTLGGVSIFDFHDFNSEQYREKFPMSSWYSFVPCKRDTTQAIWIKISPERLPGKFLNGLQLKKLQEERKAYKYKLMPRIECAHVGPIPVASFVEVLQYDKSSGFTKL